MIYSPTQVMQIIERIEKCLWAKFVAKKYDNVRRYMKRWQQDVIEYDWNDIEVGCHKNFEIINQPSSTVIDLAETLHGIQDVELLLKIAFDLGVEVPSVIYAVPEVKEILASDYTDAHNVFESAYKKLESEPDIAISMASATLERIVRDLCSDCNPCARGDTLYDLISHILKEYDYFPSADLNAEIKKIGSGILTMAQGAESIRSNYTRDAHGSQNPKYMQDQPLYAKLIFNSITTIALFLLELKQVRVPIAVPDTTHTPVLKDIPF